MYPKYKLRRYHRDVYVPKNSIEMIKEFIKQLPFIDLTDHAAQEMLKDKFGLIPLPTLNELFDSNNEIIEFFERLDNGQPTGTIQKLVIRVKTLNNKYDYTYVVAREGFIVTSWTTKKEDKHRLTKSLYEYYVPERLKNHIYSKFKTEKLNE